MIFVVVVYRSALKPAKKLQQQLRARGMRQLHNVFISGNIYLITYRKHTIKCYRLRLKLIDLSTSRVEFGNQWHVRHCF